MKTTPIRAIPVPAIKNTLKNYPRHMQKWQLAENKKLAGAAKKASTFLNAALKGDA